MKGPQRTAFSTSEAARFTGVSHRTVDFWAKTKLVVPSIVDASGIGTDRQYNFRDLIALRVAGELRGAGISTEALRKAIQFVKTSKRDPLSECRLLAIGRSVAWVNAADEAIDVLRKPGQGLFAFMFDYPKAVQEVRREIRKPPVREARTSHRLAVPAAITRQA